MRQHQTRWWRAPAPPPRLLAPLLACLGTTWATAPAAGTTGTMTVCVHNATERNEEWEDACEGCEVHARIWLSSSSSFSGVVGGCGEGQNSGYNSNDEKHWAMCQTATVEEDGDAVDWSGECSCCSFYWVEGDTEVQVRASPPLPWRGLVDSRCTRPTPPRHAPLTTRRRRRRRRSSCATRTRDGRSHSARRPGSAPRVATGHTSMTSSARGSS